MLHLQPPGQIFLQSYDLVTSYYFNLRGFNSRLVPRASNEKIQELAEAIQNTAQGVPETVEHYVVLLAERVSRNLYDL